MRGKGRVRHAVHRFVGITPACAGKSLSASDQTVCPKDHPRVCGGKSCSSPGTLTTPGSPPRMRGKALENGGGSLDVRITPACAGKSHFATNFHLNKRDHPRMCGEKWFLPSRSVRDRGSPPHVRGKARQQEHLAAQSGITPACAGKSREYRVSDERSLGSPPRMRGKVLLQSSGDIREWDHPRVCGEKSM